MKVLLIPRDAQQPSTTGPLFICTSGCCPKKTGPSSGEPRAGTLHLRASGKMKIIKMRGTVPEVFIPSPTAHIIQWTPLPCSVLPHPSPQWSLLPGDRLVLSLAAAGAGRGRILQWEVMLPWPELFAEEETVLRVWCLAQVSLESQDRGQAVCLELGALDHTSWWLYRLSHREGKCTRKRSFVLTLWRWLGPALPARGWSWEEVRVRMKMSQGSRCDMSSIPFPPFLVYAEGWGGCSLRLRCLGCSRQTESFGVWKLVR